jgi:hypothetical protein
VRICDAPKPPFTQGRLSEIETRDKNPTYGQTIGRIYCFTDTRANAQAFLGKKISTPERGDKSI